VRTALASLIVACGVACLAPRTAHAGRSYYGWLFGSEVMPERGVELQTWIQDENDKYGTRIKETWLSWGANVGITDQLELGLPIELVWSDTVSATDPMMEKVSFTFKRFGIEARYRLVPADPAEAPPYAPLLRVAVKRDVTVRDSVRIEGDAVVTYDLSTLQAVVDVGFTGDLSASSRHFELHPGAGVSVLAVGDLRVGVEGYGEFSLDSAAESWATAGPNLSWTHGRFWVSGMLGIGLYHVKLAPRVIWGIAF
jgi:hypothetical protein